MLNDEINSAREVTKTDALRLNTFQSRDHGVLGVVDADRVVFYRSGVKRHTAKSEFDVSARHEAAARGRDPGLSGRDGDLIKAAVDGGAKGIVMATAGAGATSGTQQDGIGYALKKGVPVVTTTRTGSGRIAPPRRGPNAPPFTPNPNSPLTAEDQRRRIAGEDLAPVKARVLLMLALTRTSDPAEIQRIFEEYLGPRGRRAADAGALDGFNQLARAKRLVQILGVNVRRVPPQHRIVEPGNDHQTDVRSNQTGEDSQLQAVERSEPDVGDDHRRLTDLHLQARFPEVAREHRFVARVLETPGCE